MSLQNRATEEILSASSQAIEAINGFSFDVLRTRGGRLGSGMGTLLEALWGYNVNRVLSSNGSRFELAWIVGNDYNDFACVEEGKEWTSESRTGEVFRIEAKSMNQMADESKGHFDEIKDNIGNSDLLLVLIWSWEKVDDYRVYPKIADHFIGSALSVATLRDTLHVARGGTFVDRRNCPDRCQPRTCKHHGEPLNANGKRERVSGPKATRPSEKVSYASNFGGLVRMLKTESDEARSAFRKLRASDGDAHEYITFIHRNFAQEEHNQYVSAEWKKLAIMLGIDTAFLTKPEIIEAIRTQYPEYREALRNIA
ncbi:MAG: hypothetical protein HZB53_10355 [Chloroflexi bacterium]|nr:hypothetical protein [Chloroflexota bacterium]